VVTFKPGQLDQGDLNRAVLQLLYVSQEAHLRLLPRPRRGGGILGVHGVPEVHRPAALEVVAAAAFRILFARFLAGLPNQPPPGDLQPWLNGGLLASTPRWRHPGGPRGPRGSPPGGP
jgi:hypothetical protein